MGSLGEEDLEQLVIDYMESPMIASDELEKPSGVLMSLQVYIYSHLPSMHFYLSFFFV